MDSHEDLGVENPAGRRMDYIRGLLRGVRTLLVMDNLLGSPVWSLAFVLSPTLRVPDHHPTVGGRMASLLLAARCSASL